ncbi:MAG: methionine--tRNA ligase [Prochloraceae cyanobacterium]
MKDNQTSNRKFTLTTPLYYVNDKPHVGSAYTTIAADVIARFKKLQGYSVLLVTGCDEHGQKIQRTAESLGIDPQLHCDRTAPLFEDLWQKLNVQHDRFIRTTAKQHEKIVKEFFDRVWENQDIYLDRQQGWYCVACEEFKEERELDEDKHCLIHTNKKAEWRDEENYFFRLSKYQQQIEELHDKNPNFVRPETRRNEVLNFVKSGLKDFSISRVNLDWGFAIPKDPKHTIYVWFDALLGYVTALLEPEQEPTLENALSNYWPANLHIVGKDILRFHAIYWPAMLLSAGVPLPEQIFGHGFLTKDGKKMSKTLGNTIDPFDLAARYGADAFRYYFIKEIEFGRDGDFRETRFIDVLNADLANDLGNLLNRTLGMIKKYCQGSLPKITAADVPEDNPLKKIGLELSDRAGEAYENLKFDRACEEIFNLVRASNKYIDDSAPWSLYKQKKQTEVELVLYSVSESIRLSAYLLAPIIPNLSNDIYQQLGFTIDFNDKIAANSLEIYQQHAKWGFLAANQNLSRSRPIFPQLEPPVETSKE